MVPEPDLTPQKDEIERHITHLTRRWGELAEPCLLEVVHLSAEDKAQVKQVSHYSPDEIGLSIAADDIATWNAMGINCYATVNPVSATNRPKAGRRASAEHIIASFFHFADADSQQAADNIRNFVGPKPTFVIITGQTPCVRPHVYWELEDPTRNLDAWSRTQAAISDTLKTDRVIDPPRIMRIGGTVNWPKPQKRAKGYKPEITLVQIYDREPVTSDNMARAFAQGAAKTADTGGIHIDTGPQPLDRERERIKALSGEEWNNAVFRLVGSYVAKGLSDGEILSLCEPLTLPGYTVDQTRDEVADMIRRTRENPKFHGNEDKDEKTEQRFEEEAEQAEAKEWPTLFDDFNEMAIQPRQWVYANHYLRGFVSVLASAGGIGKTSLQIVEALAIATGKPLMGEAVKEQCNVWIVNLEDPMDEMKRRILAAMNKYGITSEDVRGKLFVDAGRDFSLTFAAQTKHGITPNVALVEYLKKKIPERQIGCVFIDPFVGSHEVNENDNMAINAVISQIREVADETNAAFGLVHHIRKGNGEDANIDSVRGAGSLIGAARAARVINRLSVKDAQSVGISLEDALSIFRVDDGKANLAPPAQRAVYRKMEGVQIANGEWIGVATKFELPDEWAGMTENVVNEILGLIDKGMSNDGTEEYFSGRPQDGKRWVGNVILDYPFLKAEDQKTAGQVKAIIRKWMDTALLEEVEFYSAAQRKNRKGVISTGRVGDVK